MTIVPLLLFCSLCLVAGSIVLFVFSAGQGDCHEADRLCLMPLEDDTGTGSDREPPADVSHQSPSQLNSHANSK